MKKVVRNFIIATMLFMSFGIMLPNAFGQSPQKLSYQAVIRSSTGGLVIPPALVSMKVSVFDVTTEVYAETFTNVAPNENGLVTLEIGGGVPVGVYDFSLINWASGTFSIKTETDITSGTGTTYDIIGTSNLLSVPFALYSLNGVAGPTGPQGIQGDVGPIGPQGPQGIQGDVGPIGTQGPQGIQGDVGPIGPQGIQGIQGDVGPIGPQGTQGIQGIQGDVGPIGPQGIQGIQGIQGDVGLQGPIGLTGDVGPIGPMGPQGPAGVLSVNCLECHDHQSVTGSGASNLVSMKNEYEFSKHGEGKELALEEGYSTSCAPCHANEGFHSVVDGNVIPTYTGPVSGKYTFAYAATAAASTNLTTWPGNVGCFTCHSALPADSMARLSFASVPSTMWSFPGKTKSFDIPKNNHESNLCIKCHQPRPMSRISSTSVVLAVTAATVTMNVAFANGAAVDYDDLAANPSNLFYDSLRTNAANQQLFPGYRSHNHYGTVGAIFAGNGAVEFTGPSSYTDTSTHRLNASCQMCHMARPVAVSGEAAGGHTFIAKGNVNGCKVTGCHPSWTTYSNTTVTNIQTAHKNALVALAGRLKTGTVEIMHKNTDPLSNIFAGLTTQGYSGYLDIYDPSINPLGLIRNPVTSSSWTAANKALNLTLEPLKSLTNAEWGAIINFQMMLREFSNGIHNPKYTQALFANTNAALTAVGIP